MSKIIKYLKNIIFLINIMYTVYFIINRNNFAMNYEYSISFLFYILTMLMLLVFEIMKFRRKDPLKDDLKYNSFYLLVNLMILFLILRNFIDPNLFFSYYYIDESYDKMRSFFISNNFIYINIMNSCLIAYYYVNRLKKVK